MARYIDADKLLIEMEKKIGETSASIFYYTVLKDVVNLLPIADVVEREKIDKAIEEIKHNASNIAWLFDDDWDRAIEKVIEIIKRNTGE